MKLYSIARLKRPILPLLIILTSSISSVYGRNVTEPIDSVQLFEEAKQVINQVNSDFLVAIRKGDFKTIAEPYGENGVFVGPSGETIVGAEKIEKYYSKGAKAVASLTDVALVQEGITMVGKFVYEWGRCDFYIGPKDQASSKRSGRYVTIWMKDKSNQWRIIRNLSLP
jgi:ketosteroid isomerase-like protein